MPAAIELPDAAVVDTTGVVRNRYNYEPYGVTTETCHATLGCITNPWRYTGQHHDTTTGPYKIGHRYYQPDLGRWTQPDPLNRFLNPAMPSEGHPYNYVGGNPTNYTVVGPAVSGQSISNVLYAFYAACCRLRYSS